MAVENAGAEAGVIEFGVMIPPTRDLPAGFDPLPDAGWVRLDRVVRHALDPGQTAKTDIVVSVPKDSGLDGGQYAFDCAIKGRNAAGSSLTLKTRVTFAVGEADEQGEDGDAPEEFTVTARSARIEGVELGRRVTLRNERFQGLKLANAGTRPLRVRLGTSRRWPKHLRPETGFGAAPNPRWLKTGPVVTVPAGAVVTVPLYVEIPPQARYAGQSWSFAVTLDVDNGKSRGRRWFIMSLTTKEDLQEETRLNR